MHSSASSGDRRSELEVRIAKSSDHVWRVVFVWLAMSEMGFLVVPWIQFGPLSVEALALERIRWSESFYRSTKWPRWLL